MKKTDVVQPVAMASAFAEGVYSATSTSDFEIPAATSTGATDTCVLDDGFLPITSTALDDGGIAPERKNFNGMFYLSTDQRFYLQNGGFITYDANVATAIGGYPQDAILGYIDGDGVYKLVRSLIDDNTNNFVTTPSLIDGTHWEEIPMGGSSRNIGEIVPSTIPLTDAGLHLLDGALISGSGSYSAFVDFIADLYDSGDYSAIFTTEATWQSTVTSTGYCDKFVYDSVNNTVRLPKYGNQLIIDSTVASTVGVHGNGMSLGMTNGSATAGVTGNTAGGFNATANAYGATLATASQTTTQITGIWGVTSDASKSGLVADIASIGLKTVDVYYYVVVATTAKTAIEVDIDQIATDLNGKAGVDLANLNDAGDIYGGGLAFPIATSYESLTIGATGTSYTAPANGWYAFQVKSTATNQRCLVSNASLTMGNTCWSSAQNQAMFSCVPALKGQSVAIYYQGTAEHLYFYYAKGSESEYTP